MLTGLPTVAQHGVHSSAAQEFETTTFVVLKPGTVWAGKGSNKHVESKSTGSSGGNDDKYGGGIGDGHSGDSDSSSGGE